MIDDLLAQWPLFWRAWVGGALIAMTLAAPGVLVVARRRVFLGAAVAQAATLGVALGLVIGGLGLGMVGGDTHAHGHAHGSAILPTALALIAGIAAAVAIGRRDGDDARTAWVFLAGSALALLVLAKSPHGMKEVEHLMAPSLIAAGTAEVVVFAIATLVTLVVGGCARDRLALLAIDPAIAPALGIDRGRWDLGLHAWLGASLALAIHAGGLMYAFGCLVLPALAARGACRTVRGQLVAAPVIAGLTALATAVAADRWDLPPGQLAVAVLCALVLVGRGIGALRR